MFTFRNHIRLRRFMQRPDLRVKLPVFSNLLTIWVLFSLECSISEDLRRHFKSKNWLFISSFCIHPLFIKAVFMSGYSLEQIKIFLSFSILFFFFHCSNETQFWLKIDLIGFESFLSFFIISSSLFSNLQFCSRLSFFGTLFRFFFRFYFKLINHP